MKTVLLILLTLPLIAFSQDDDKESIFTNTTVLEIFVNKESNYSNEKVELNKGFGFEISTFNGIMLFKRINISLGLGISFNVNKDFKALPIVGDVKWYLNSYGLNSPYVLLNAGTNIKIGSFKRGHSSKLGLGFSFESDYSFQYVVEGFIKSKEFFLYEDSDFNYNASSVGISIGIKL